MTSTTQARTDRTAQRYTFCRGRAGAVLVTHRALTGAALPEPVASVASVVAASLG